MTRVLRGAWSRRGLLLPLALLGLVVTCGVVVVVSLSGPADLDLAYAAPLLVLGAVAFPVAAGDLVSARRGEVALARLRGVRRPRIVVGLAAEPVLALVAGGLLGALLGVLAARLLADHVLVASAAEPGAGALAVAVAAVAAAGALLGSAAAATTLHEPLARQVSAPQRVVGASTLALFGQVLVLVAAVVATYAARAEGDPGWLALAAPAMVGLAAGQLAVWLVRGVATVSAARTGAGVAWFLAVRRVARGADTASTLRLVVAAAVVAGSATASLVAQAEWSDDTAHLAMAAPVQYRTDLGAHQALDLTRELDPEGRWLMAGVVVSDRLAPVPEALIDTERYPRVVGDYLDQTGADGIGDRVAALAPDGAGDVLSTRGTSVEVALAVDPTSRSIGTFSIYGRAPRPSRVEFEYVTDQGFTSTVQLRPDREGKPREARLADCAGGCSLIRVTISDVHRAASTLRTLRFGELDLLAGGRLSVGGRPAQGAVELEHDPDVPVELVPTATPVPVLAAEGTAAGKLVAPGGEGLEARRSGTAPALPLVQGHGVVADIGRLLRGTAPSGNDVTTLLLARSDMPADLRTAISERTGAKPETLTATRTDLDRSTGADRGRVDVVGGLLCLLVALPVIGVAVGRTRRIVRHEAAALRAIGTPHLALRGAGRRQFLLIGLPAGMAAVVGAAVVDLVVRPDLQLIDRPPGAIAVPGGLVWWTLALTFVVVLGLVLAWGGRSAAGGEPTTRPATLWRGEGS